MFTRFRIGMGLALAAFMLTWISVSAKGGFDFIEVGGSDLHDTVQIRDTRLTEDFFSFANFYEDKTESPADPGPGYEITRHYVQGIGDIVFDRLHYYPETGLVFYDGIENGESEYDGEWYTADPALKPIFESALALQIKSAGPAEKEEPVASAPGLPSDPSLAEGKPVPSGRSSATALMIVLAAGVAGLFASLLWRRKVSTE